MNQYTQDYSFHALLAQTYGSLYGEIKKIEPIYGNILNPTGLEKPFNTSRNELFFMVQGSFDLINVELLGSFDTYFNDSEFHSTQSDIAARVAALNIYQHTTNIFNRSIKSIRNLVNIEFITGMGYMITYKENVFNVIP